MEKAIRYTLGKQERLKSRKAIDHLFTKGKSFSAYPLRIIYHLSPNEGASINCSLKAGFTVGTKHFKKATDRNRIKRLIKESYRLQKNELQQNVQFKNIRLEIFFIYTGKELAEYKLILNKTSSALKQLLNIINENSK